MIALQRYRVGVPQAFRPPAIGRAAAKLIQIYFAQPGGPYGFESSAWKPAKSALKRESHGKCAYCEAPTDVVAHGDVEHFRPKSDYWWLAFCFDNYLFSCQICNQSYKGDKFPIAGQRLAAPAMPAMPPEIDDPAHAALVATLVLDATAVVDDDLRSLWSDEDADLPHPCFEDPEALFAYRVDDLNQEIVLESAGGARANRAFAAVVDCLGLNRDELKRERYVNYATLAAFKAILDSGAPPEVAAIAIEEVRRMQAASEPFAGMRRYFARTWALPGPV